MNTEIDNSTVVKQANHLVTADMDGETVMLSIKSGMYYGLDSIGSRIWGLIQAPKTISELVGVLAQEYEVAPEQCYTDTLEFIEDLYNKGLICLDKPA